MTRALNVLDSDGPLAHYVGVCLIILSVGAFIAGIILAAPASDYRDCIDHGGSWSHTLAQHEDQHDAAHWTDTCTMPGGHR